MTLGWGVVGVGGYADRHLIPAIVQASGGKLIAVCHYDQEKADLYANRHGALRSYVDLAAMAADPEIDVVAVATPVNLHAEHGAIAARAGKHVFVEIPMEATIPAAQALVRTCRDAGVKLGVGYEHRFHPAHLEMRRLIAEGEIGEISHVEAHFSVVSDGGLTLGQTYWKLPPRPDVVHSSRRWTENPGARGGNAVVHLGIALDMLHYLVGRPVEEITAFTDVMTDPDGRERKVAAILNFEGGIYAYAFGGHDSPYDENTVTVYGTEGRLRGIRTLMLPTMGQLEILRVRGKGLAKGVARSYSPQPSSANLYFEGERTVTTTEYPGANMYVTQIEAFNRCIAEDFEPPCSGLDGLWVRDISDGILQSSRERRVVELSAVREVLADR
jgi:predicted dehydrogenase